MKGIRLAYPDLQNAGDVLNVELIERLSGKKVLRSKVYNADMFAIGGALFGAQYSPGTTRRILQTTLGLIYGNKPLYVWGSGFLYGDNPNKMYRKNLKICALRGEKTRQKLSTLTGQNYDVPLADAGLLADMFIDSMPDKKYEIGLIPHFSQQNEMHMVNLSKKENVYFIDIRNTPRQVIREIAECEYVLSSSLHGLIFADSLHVPSLHIGGETELMGGNFKFEDYYSSYGIDDEKWDLNKQYPTVNDIIDSYKIKKDVVEDKKKALIECFPKF